MSSTTSHTKHRMFAKLAIFGFLLVWVLQPILAQNSDNRFVLFSQRENALFMFNGENATKITGEEFVVTFAVADDSIFVVTDSAKGQDLSEYDRHGQYLSTLTEFDVTNTPYWTDLTSIPASNELIAELEFSSDLESGLYRFDPSDFFSNLTFLAAANFSEPDVSPDGRFLVYNVNAQRQNSLGTPYIHSVVARLDLETKEWIYITSELQDHCQGATWHPTDNVVIYHCATPDSGSRIYMTNLETAETQLLPMPPNSDLISCTTLAWSPDGSKIAYNMATGIAILSLDTMTFDFLDYPEEIIVAGGICFEWLP